jgi:acetyl esterase/lipase
MLKKFFLITTVCVSFYCSAQQVMPLYQGAPPNSLPVQDIESAGNSTGGNGRFFVTNVTTPTLTVYLPKKMNAAKTAIIICPGGGYSRLSIEDGGHEAAKVLTDAGIVAFVLKYRTQRDDAYTSYKEVPLMDLTKALEIVYSHAKKWEIDPAHIGIMGFSAGGHLTTMAATSLKENKPAFTILAYPVISFMDSLTSKTSGSRGNLLGKKISEEEKIKYSPELHVTAATPPAFLLHAEDDNTALVGNSIVYHKKLQSFNIPTELIIYKKGGHGFALYNKAENKYWMPEALNWLTKNGFYKKKYTTSNYSG